MDTGTMVRMALRRTGFVSVQWMKRDPRSFLHGWLSRGVVRPPKCAAHRLVEHRATLTDHVGSQPLWEGYGEGHARRTSDQVRTGPTLGRLYTDLIVRKRPDVVVEFGSAFGVSGMYWLAGLGAADKGHLYSFEPNEGWAAMAADNLSAIGTRFTLTVGTFEDEVAAVLAERQIDVAFIDAIHTPEFVGPQFSLVAAHARPGALIVLDDIDFSSAMRRFWTTLARDERVLSSATVGDHVGLIELG